MRGFFGGLIIGLVVLAAAAVMLSLSSPLPERPEVGAEPERAAGADPAAQGDSGLGKGAGRDADLVEAAPVSPGDAAASDDLEGMKDADTEPADKPQVGNASPDLGGSQAAPDQPGVSVGAEVPVASPAAPGDAPSAPSGDSDVTVAAGQPTQPALPDVTDTGSGFGASGTVPEAAPSEPSRASDPQLSGGDPATAVVLPGQETTPAPSTETAAAPEPAMQPEPAATPDAWPAPPSVNGTDMARPQPGQATPIPEATAEAGDAPSPDTSPADAPEPSSRVAALPQAGTDEETSRVAIGDKVVPLTERDAAAPETVSEPFGQRPLEAFAEPFKNPEDKPLMAIVLIDDDDSIGVEALADFPYPLTFALDPSAPDAAEKMARHRAGGAEVVALADLPAAATPQDAEVTLAVWMAQLPEIVALLEGTGTGVQGSRQLSDQVTAITGSTGHGLILQDNGLNTAHKLAARAGVPSALVFRDFDGAGQTPTVMRRFLDQAAFRARQEGAVIMLGRVRPDTISALLLWGLQDRASSVALAPVSAILRGKAD